MKFANPINNYETSYYMKSKFLPTLCASICSHKLRVVPTFMLLALPLYGHALPSDANQQIKLLIKKKYNILINKMISVLPHFKLKKI